MRLLPRGPTRDLKKHRIINMQACQRIKRRGRQEDFVASFQVGLVLEGEGVAVVFFVEGLGETGAAPHSAHALVVPAAAAAKERCHCFLSFLLVVITWRGGMNEEDEEVEQEEDDAAVSCLWVLGKGEEEGGGECRQDDGGKGKT